VFPVHVLLKCCWQLIMCGLHQGWFFLWLNLCVLCIITSLQRMALDGLFCGLATDDDVAGDGLSGEGGKVDHLLPEVRSQMSIVLSARDELFTLPLPALRQDGRELL
jgi:hypothetical protein